MLSFARDYQEWLKVADKALPRNIFGYLLQLCLSPLRTNPFTLLPYDNPSELAKCGGNGGRKSFLPQNLPERDGPRPEIGKWIAPHRQFSQWSDHDTIRVCPLSDL
jgi:hypothetical protein